MTMENEKIPHETPEVLSLSTTFTPKTLAIASLGVAVLLLACMASHTFFQLEFICVSDILV